MVNAVVEKGMVNGALVTVPMGLPSARNVTLAIPLLSEVDAVRFTVPDTMCWFSGLVMEIVGAVVSDVNTAEIIELGVIPWDTAIACSVVVPVS